MQQKTTILYVEDDKTLAFVTKDNLEQNGYKIVHFEDGKIALSNLRKYNFDLCILDIMLPKMDGFQLAKKIRETNREVPILFLSAKSQTEDKIQGLELGADDYITKPFSIDELRLKIEVFLRRCKISDNTVPNTVSVGNYVLHIPNQILRFNNQETKLTQRETALVQLLFENKNQLIKREEILKQIWGDDSYFNGRSLDVFMSRIRKYLKDDPSIVIENIRSTGFRLIYTEV